MQMFFCQGCMKIVFLLYFGEGCFHKILTFLSGRGLCQNMSAVSCLLFENAETERDSQ